MTATSETLTVLRARGRRLTKLHRSDGVTLAYDQVRLVDAAAVPAPDLNALYRLLLRLLPRSECCIVRGALINGSPARSIRRLLHPCPRTGDVPTLRDAPRTWVALDMECIILPPTISAADLAGCARIAVATLPAAFQGAAAIVQASASHGLRPDLRLRLWYELDRPTWGHELKRWLAGTPADPSVFSAAQPIYTAAPLFVGMADPLPMRLLWLPGEALVRVPSPATLAPLPRPSRSAPALLLTQAHRYVRAALEAAAGRIATAEKRHPAIIREASNLARLVRAGLLEEAQMRAVLTQAARYAGKTDENEIAACIAWGLAHPAHGAVPELRQ